MGRHYEGVTSKHRARCVGFFLPFRDEIVRKYNKFLSGSGGSASATQRSFGRRWGWFPSYIKIAKRNNFTINEATNVSLHEALTLLSYESERAELIEKELKRGTSI